MTNRKLKKLAKAGSLFTVIGTHCVFMSMGGFKNTEICQKAYLAKEKVFVQLLKGREINSFNGIDVERRVPVSRADGYCRPATKKESALYWNIMKELTGNLAPGETIEYYPCRK